MRRESREGIDWLEFELFAAIPHLVHGVFLRHGGVSEPPYSSLNIGREVGDDLGKVDENFKRIQKILNLPRCVMGKQRHGIQIRRVFSEGIQGGEECDGLITQEKGVGLVIAHADCQAALIFDPRHHAIAAVHAGWRGNVQNIYAEAVGFLKHHIGSDPKDLLVGISPSLGPEWAEFKHYETEWPESFWPFQTKPTYFDLWAIARAQFLACGVLAHHIEIASICNYSNPQDFFSYRGEKKVTGRHATVIALSS